MASKSQFFPDDLNSFDHTPAICAQNVRSTTDPPAESSEITTSLTKKIQLLFTYFPFGFGAEPFTSYPFVNLFITYPALIKFLRKKIK